MKLYEISTKNGEKNTEYFFVQAENSDEAIKKIRANEIVGDITMLIEKYQKLIV